MAAVVAHSPTAADNGLGKGKVDQWHGGDATKRECVMVTQRRWKAGRRRQYQDQGGGDCARV